MTKKKAFKLYNKYQDPKTIKEVLEEIKLFASLGFRETSFLINPLKQRRKIKDSLRKRGFDVCDDYGGLVDISWS